jgi:hypothetical protein
MGPELPSTCKIAGHEYKLDPHSCDWCGEPRRIKLQASSYHGHVCVKDHGIEFWLPDGPDIIWHPQDDHCYLSAEIPTSRPVYRPGHTEESETACLGLAGVVVDKQTAAVRSSKHGSTKEEVTTSHRTGRPGERYDPSTRTWRHPRTPTPAARRSQGRSHPRESVVTDGAGRVVAVNLPNVSPAEIAKIKADFEKAYR